jgi:hypothetical protein
MWKCFSSCVPSQSTLARLQTSLRWHVDESRGRLFEVCQLSCDDSFDLLIGKWTGSTGSSRTNTCCEKYCFFLLLLIFFFHDWKGGVSFFFTESYLGSSTPVFLTKIDESRLDDTTGQERQTGQEDRWGATEYKGTFQSNR